MDEDNNTSTENVTFTAPTKSVDLPTVGRKKKNFSVNLPTPGRKKEDPNKQPEKTEDSEK